MGTSSSRPSAQGWSHLARVQQAGGGTKGEDVRAERQAQTEVARTETARNHAPDKQAAAFAEIWRAESAHAMAEAEAETAAARVSREFSALCGPTHGAQLPQSPPLLMTVSIRSSRQSKPRADPVPGTLVCQRPGLCLCAVLVSACAPHMFERTPAHLPARPPAPQRRIRHTWQHSLLHPEDDTLCRHTRSPKRHSIRICDIYVFEFVVHTLYRSEMSVMLS